MSPGTMDKTVKLLGDEKTTLQLSRNSDRIEVKQIAGHLEY
jgi:hypothetical protein